MSDLIPYDGSGQPRRPANAPRDRSPSSGIREDGELLDFRGILVALRRHVWLIAAVTAVTLALTIFLALREPPQYRATASLRLIDERQALSGGITGAGLSEVVGSGTDPIVSQLQLLKSREIVGRVVERVGMRLHSQTPGFSIGELQELVVAEGVSAGQLTFRFADDGFVAETGTASVGGAYGEAVEISGVGFTIAERPAVDEAVVEVRDGEWAGDRVIRQLAAEPRQRTNVVDVSFVSSDPRLAQSVVNTIVDEFQAQSARTAKQQAQRRRVFLEEQLAQTDSALMGAQLLLTRFQEREAVASSQEKFAAQQVGLMGLEARREELNADRRVLAQLLSSLSSGAGGDQRRVIALLSTPAVTANPVIAQLAQQLVRSEMARDSLTIGAWGSTAENPDVQRQEAIIASTQARLLDAVRSYLGVMEARIGALDDLRQRNLAELQTMPQTGAEEARLVQQVDAMRKVSDQLREEHQRARIAEAIEAGHVEVIDRARLPVEPIPSRRSLKLVLGLMLGLMLGGGGALVIERMNTSIRRKEDLEGVLRVPGLAVIPQIANGRAAQRRLFFPVPIGGAQLNGTSGENAAELVTMSDLRSAGSEAYRTLRTNLIFSQAIQSLKTLVITSSTPAEGKTTTAANLAITFAQQGMRVLIVDCDLRKGRLHGVFGLEREPGLTQLLLGYSRVEEAVRPTPVDGLFALTAGTLPPNPAELLGGERMRELLQQLKESFDLVILDTPPLLAASDAAVLGTEADGVILVVRAGHTDRGAAQSAMHQLNAVGARVMGAVLNDPDSKIETYGGYYYYSYASDA